jgi:hypothetical protein
MLECGSKAGGRDISDQVPPAKMRHNSNEGSRSSRLLSMIGLGLQGSATLAGKTGAEALQQGLSVRMGVASGVVPAGVNISNCSLLQLAKGKEGAHDGLLYYFAAAVAADDDGYLCGKALFMCYQRLRTKASSHRC